jgi:hypothetical protein
MAWFDGISRGSQAFVMGCVRDIRCKAMRAWGMGLGEAGWGWVVEVGKLAWLCGCVRPSGRFEEGFHIYQAGCQSGHGCTGCGFKQQF